MGIKQKTLDEAYAWAKKNQETDKLAEAFMGACIAVGMSTGAIKVSERLGVKCATIWDINDHVFIYRDSLARLIVKSLKRGKLTNEFADIGLSPPPRV